MNLNNFISSFLCWQITNSVAYKQIHHLIELCIFHKEIIQLCYGWFCEIELLWWSNKTKENAVT